MKFDVYTRPDGAYVLVPDCLQASREAQRLHGPLTFCDTVDTEHAALPRPFWEQLIAEIDTRSYAVVPMQTGQRLLGIDCDASNEAA